MAVNDLDKELFIAEVKINPKKCNLFELEFKAKGLVQQYPDYKVEYECLSLRDAAKYLPRVK